MRRLWMFLLLFVSTLYGDTALIVHKGWQLIGSTTTISDMSIFSPKHVEQVWRYDALTQKWQGYSPDATLAKKIKEKGYEPIKELKSWHGFWIKSKDEWALTLPTPNGTSDENITLQKGWNLISLPIDTVVSPHIFDGKTVWKYANNNWEFFNNDKKESYPVISHITNSDGIWVKSNKKQTISVSTDAAKLHNFSTQEEMEAYIRDMVLTDRRVICGYFPLAVLEREDILYADSSQKSAGGADSQAPSIAQGEAQNSSQTNLQERGVDEADIIKHNNDAIFFLYHGNDRFSQAKIGVTTFSHILNGDKKAIATIEPHGNPHDLYLNVDKLVVISSYDDFQYDIVKGMSSDKALQLKRENAIPSFIVEIYDVADINHIQKLHEYKIDGYSKTSRVVDGKLYLVSQFYPYILYDYPPIYVDAPECKTYFHSSGTAGEVQGGTEGGGVTVTDAKNVNASATNETVQKNSRAAIVAKDYKKYARCYGLMVDKKGRYYRYDYEHPKIKSEYLIPNILIDNTTKKALITPKTLYAPNKKDQEPSITIVTAIDITSGNIEQSRAIIGYSNTVYASRKALYIVSDKYPIFYSFANFKRRSAIYKFNLGESLSFGAFGFVNGTPLNQFSLSEYNDILRIATSEGFSWQNNTVNSLYTLKNIQDRLIIQGVLNGLGKKGETIRAVRFMEDRGYIVTFKQTDPFYTLDLSDPTHPKKVGELKIEGFSSYLHPISRDLILGFGRDATPQGQALGLKMELFDVSDFSNPISIDSYTLPGNYTRSEIEYNHKALAYRESDKLFAFAYNLLNQGYRYPSHKLGVFQIAQNSIKVYQPIDAAEGYSLFQRGLIFDFNGTTYIAYFSNGEIRYRRLDDLGVVR